MAEGDSSQEKSEEPTARKLEKARADGQIPRSKELSTSLILIVGALGLWLSGGLLFDGAKHIFDYNFTISREHLFDEKQMVIHLSASALEAMLAVIPLMIMLVIAAILGPLALGGWMFSGKSLMPKLSRISPLAGFKRMFGLKSLVELAKSWAKVLIIVGCTLLLFFTLKDQVLFLDQEPQRQAIIHAMDLVITGAIFLACSTLLVSLIDIPFQIYDFTKKMKRSLKEVKD